MPMQRLQASRCGGLSNGPRFTVAGQAGLYYEIQAAEALDNWHSIGALSAPLGPTHLRTRAHVRIGSGAIGSG